jgi:hypothetical protein
VCRGTDVPLIDDRCARCHDPDGVREKSVERLAALLARAAGLAERLAARESAVVAGRAPGTRQPELAATSQRIVDDLRRFEQELRGTRNAPS